MMAIKESLNRLYKAYIVHSWKKEIARVHKEMLNYCTEPWLFSVMHLKEIGNWTLLQRHNTENSKQIFPEKELRDLSHNYYIHVSVSDLYITTIGLPFLLQENMWTAPGHI